MKFLVAGFLASKAFFKTQTTTPADPAGERRLGRVIKRHKLEDRRVRFPARSISAQQEDVLQPLYEPSVYLSPVLDQTE
jgi:hypothetical protein